MQGPHGKQYFVERGRHFGGVVMVVEQPRPCKSNMENRICAEGVDIFVILWGLWSSMQKCILFERGRIFYDSVRAVEQPETMQIQYGNLNCFKEIDILVIL